MARCGEAEVAHAPSAARSPAAEALDEEYGALEKALGAREEQRRAAAICRLTLVSRSRFQQPKMRTIDRVLKCPGPLRIV